MSESEDIIRQAARALDDAAPPVTAAEVVGALDGRRVASPDSVLQRRPIFVAAVAASVVAILIGVVTWRHSTDDAAVLVAPPARSGNVVVVRSDGRIDEIDTDGQVIRTLEHLPPTGVGSAAIDPQSPIVDADGGVHVTVNAVAGCPEQEIRTVGGVETLGSIRGHGGAFGRSGAVAYVGPRPVQSFSLMCATGLLVRPTASTARRWEEQITAAYEAIVDQAAHNADPVAQVVWNMEQDKLIARKTELHDTTGPSLSFQLLAEPTILESVLGMSPDEQRLLARATQDCLGPSSSCGTPMLLLVGPIDPTQEAIATRTVLIGGYEEPSATYDGASDDLIVWEGSAAGSRSVSRIAARDVAAGLPLPPNTGGPATIPRPGPSAMFEVTDSAGAVRVVRPDHDGRRYLVVAEHETYLWDGASLRSLGTDIIGADWMPAVASGPVPTEPSTAPTQRPDGLTASEGSRSADTTRPVAPGTSEPTTTTSAVPADWIRVDATVLHEEPLVAGDVNLWYWPSGEDIDPPSSGASGSSGWRALFQKVRVEPMGKGVRTPTGRLLRSAVTLTVPPEASLWIQSAEISSGILVVTPSTEPPKIVCRPNEPIVDCLPLPTFQPEK